MRLHGVSEQPGHKRQVELPIYLYGGGVLPGRFSLAKGIALLTFEGKVRGQIRRANLVGNFGGQLWRANLEGNSGGQARGGDLGEYGGQSWRANWEGKSGGQVWGSN